MNRNPQDINKVTGMNKLSALIIMFLMAAVVFILFLLMSASLALADSRGRGMGSRFGQGFFENDGLTPEESAKMEKIRKEHLKGIVPLRQELVVKKGELRLIDFSSKTNAGRIDGLRKDIQDLQGKIREKNLQYWFHCQDLLTPEQQDSVSSFGPGRGAGRGWGDR
ncbi:MAG: periplasmic heavy metal sensor [Deltaproteobacteria bacterium]|nr:periplasmic heavy metal sensor [Deltaproteobacteria bacterium]